MLTRGLKLLPLAALLIGTAVTVAGCNTVTGAVGGVGRDVRAIGDTIAGVDNRDCYEDRCRKRTGTRYNTREVRAGYARPARHVQRPGRTSAVRDRHCCGRY